MEAPGTFDSVALFPASVISRSGPDVDCAEGGLQPAPSGEYFLRGNSQQFDCRLLSTQRPSSHSTSSCCSSVPGQFSIRHRRTSTTNDCTSVSTGISSPERTESGLMEAPGTFDSVALFPASVISRSGPDVDCAEGGLQPAPSGEYFLRGNSQRYDCHLPFAQRSSQSNEVNRTTSIDGLLIYYQNVGGMNNSITDYLLASSACCYDVVILSETWLNDLTLSNQIFGNNYEVFRCDRNPHNNRKTTGGGVLIAVRSGIKAQTIESDTWNSVEQLWVRIDLLDRKLYVCAVYIPPDRVRDMALIGTHTASVMDVLSKASPWDELLIVGDYNFPQIKWTGGTDGFLFPDISQSHLHCGSREVLDAYNAATLRQINRTLNENGRLLDLCFASERVLTPNVTVAPAPLVKDARHHPPLLISINYETQVQFISDIRAVRYDFSKADFHAMTSFLASVEWNSILDKDDANEAAQTFSHIVSHAIDRHVPKVAISSTKTPWFTDELRKLKAAKRKALRKYTKFRSEVCRIEYNRLNDLYKRASKDCFQRHQRKLESSFRHKPKRFWRHINEQRKESGLPSMMSFNGQSANNLQDICNLFGVKLGNTFQNLAVPDQQIAEAASNVPLNHRSISSMDIAIDEVSLKKGIDKLISSTSLGPDGIPALVIKKCTHQLLEPLRHVFSLSLTSGVFPTCWKFSHMFPVHKKGDKRNIDNYRGISALSATAKLFELIILDPVFFHCKEMISTDQHGFFSKRSTTSNLLSFTSYVQDGFANGVQTDAIYTDLSAAFDTVNHKIAVAKLERLGFCGSLLRWFRDYLHGRTLSVSIGDCISDPFSAPSGVPQGSHLGPLIFLLYFNDVNFVLRGPKLSYADDLKLFLHIRNSEDSMRLQRELDVFANWCRLNCLSLNISKCSVISYSRKETTIIAPYAFVGQVVARVTVMKDLGVMLDSKLNYKAHCEYIIANASRNLGFIMRSSRDFTDVYCLKSLYCALVRSMLEFASTVWSPHFQNAVDRIESIQRRFIRFALRRLNWTDRWNLPRYEYRCMLINLDTLANRRKVARAMVVADLLTTRMDCPYLLEKLQLRGHRSLRNVTPLVIPFRRTNYGCYGALVGLCRTFNELSRVFDFNLSRRCLKSKLETECRNSDRLRMQQIP